MVFLLILIYLIRMDRDIPIANPLIFERIQLKNMQHHYMELTKIKVQLDWWRILKLHFSKNNRKIFEGQAKKNNFRKKNSYQYKEPMNCYSIEWTVYAKEVIHSTSQFFRTEVHALIKQITLLCKIWKFDNKIEVVDEIYSIFE